MASKKTNDSKLVTGAIIGGLIGVSTLAIYLATRNQKSSLNRFGETISRVGEILEEHNIQEPAELKVIERKIHKHEDSITELMGWVATGIDLWRKFKK
jgi:hypothetical protein